MWIWRFPEASQLRMTLRHRAAKKVLFWTQEIASVIICAIANETNPKHEAALRVLTELSVV